MRGLLQLLWASMVGLLLWTGAPNASARTTNVAELAKRLASGEDFRVRTQAALALGASAQKSAVKPLCRGLDDDNTTVRAAAAAALGRLALGGRECLAERLRKESQADVKSVIQRALEKLKPAAPGIDGDTRVYVAIGSVKNKTSRSDDEVSGWVRAALVKYFAEQGGVAVAPESETPAQAKKLLKKYPNVKAIMLLPTLKLKDVGGAMQVKLEIALLTYPGQVLKGSASRKLTMPDTPLSDTASIKELLQMAAEKMVPDIRRTAARI